MINKNNFNTFKAQIIIDFKIKINTPLFYLESIF